MLTDAEQLTVLQLINSFTALSAKQCQQNTLTLLDICLVFCSARWGATQCIFSLTDEQTLDRKLLWVADSSVTVKWIYSQHKGLTKVLIYRSAMDFTQQQTHLSYCMRSGCIVQLKLLHWPQTLCASTQASCCSSLFLHAWLTFFPHVGQPAS